MIGIGKTASDGTEICVGDTVGVCKFSSGYLFTVKVESADKFKLLSDYDIGPTNPNWREYENADNVIGRESYELFILER